uniref:Uncharacterized protein n=1 Tax=Fagus sylvatica TaxID=28930 RepID=A0A2N9IDK4_FAGSY
MPRASCYWSVLRCVVSSDFWRFFEWEGFCGVFIPSSRVFVLFTKRKKFLLSVWVPSSRFPVSLLCPFLLPSFSGFLRGCIPVNLDSLSLSFKSFFVGVSRFAENGLGPPPIEGFVSPDSVLHRLSAELYSVICPAIHTWEAVRNRMVANEAEWPLPLSEELPEGLSDESNGGMTREVSSGAVPSTSGSRPLPRVDRSWKAMSYLVNLTRMTLIGLDVVIRFLMTSSLESQILTREHVALSINTMKLNKSRLRQMAQSGEVAAAPISLKRKKPDEGSSKRAEEAPPRPSAQVATPPVIPTIVPSVQRDPSVILVDSDFTPPTAASTINQSPLVAMDRAKGAITTPDMEEYAVAHTEDLSLLMVHSLMRGLTEAMVMARRCTSVEEDLAMLRAKSIADKAEMKSTKRAVMELTKERKEALAEAEKLRTELKARDDDVKAAVDAKDKAVADLKHLVGQIEGAKEAAVSEFRASEAFEDINTRYFLSGFEAFRKQAVQRFPGLDFSALQPYDDEDSVAGVSQDQAGDDDVSSK